MCDRKEYLPYIMLRINDNVLEIRQQALKITKAILPNVSLHEMLDVTSVYIDVMRGERKGAEITQELKTLFHNELRSVIPIIDWNDLSKHTEKVRGTWEEWAFSTNKIGLDKALQWLHNEKGIRNKRIIIKGILNDFELPDDILNSLINKEKGQIKLYLLQYKYNKVGRIWDGIDLYLLDSSPSVRALVKFIILKYKECDILSYYYSHLDYNEEISILGIGENGTMKDIPFIEKYLNSKNKKTIKSALSAISNILKEDGATYYWRYVSSGDSQMIKHALRIIKKYKIQYPAIDIYRLLETKSDTNEKYYLALLIKADSWERLPYLLKYYDYNDERIRYDIHRAIHKRYYAKKITDELYAKIEYSLKYSFLPSTLVAAIRFDLKYMYEKK